MADEDRDKRINPEIFQENDGLARLGFHGFFAEQGDDPKGRGPIHRAMAV
jgi:hypothetical protein